MSNVSDFHTDFSTIEKATWEIRKPLYVAVYHTHPLELNTGVKLIFLHFSTIVWVKFQPPIYSLIFSK